jgi:hypothetical protein
LGFKQNRKALGALLIALIVIGVVIIIIGVSLVAFFLIFASPGAQKTQTYTNTDFNSVDVGSAFQVTVNRADTYSVKITAGERVFDRIKVTQDGGTLKIQVTPGMWMWGVFDAKAEITLPTVENMTFSGATRATADGFSGNGKLFTHISGASSLDLTNSNFGDIDIELSGASRMTGQGTGANLTSTVSGASNLDLNNFQVANADLEVSGASHAVVNPTGTLNVNASGASSVQYVGNPTLGNIQTSGASSVNKK